MKRRIGTLVFVMLAIAASASALPPWPMQPFTGGQSGVVSRYPVGATAHVFSSAGSITLGAEHVGGIVLMTAAGEVGLPDCSADSIGYFVVVHVRDASEQVELVMSGDTTSDIFRLTDATELDANDEADMPTGGNQAVSVTCMEENKWYIRHGGAACTDGGAAD